MKLSSLVRLVLPLLCACASPESPRPQHARVASPQTSTVRTASAAMATAYWARILVGVDAAGLRDNWKDIAVSNQGDLGRRVCEAVVENQLRVLQGAGFTTRVDHSCATSPLAPVKLLAGEHILVAERVLSDVELLLLLPRAPDNLEPAGGATLTEFSRFTSADACQQTLARLATIRQQDRAAAAEDAKRWLEGQSRVLEEGAKQACEEQDRVEARCASLRVGKAELELACSASMKSKRCSEAQERAVEHYQCMLGHTRSCEQARALLEGVRKRLTAPPDPEPNTASAPACR
jgi:hypothetical protein